MTTIGEPIVFVRCAACSWIGWSLAATTIRFRACPSCLNPSHLHLGPQTGLAVSSDFDPVPFDPERFKITEPDPAPAGSEGSPPGFSPSREPPNGGRPAERASGGPRPIDSAMWDFITGAERMRLAGKSEDQTRRIAALAVEGVYLDA